MPETQPPDWPKIVDKHAERVFRVAYRILGSVHDAEDCSQDVFAEAMLAYRAGPIQTWTGLLVRLATLRAIDQLRKRRAPSESYSDAIPKSTTQGQPEQSLIASELADWLRGEISTLPDQQATVFTLTYFEQLSRTEIASALELSVEAVSTTLYKARQRLSQRLAVYNGDQS